MHRLEFRRRDSFPLHTEMTGGGAFGVLAGEWTDDTAMALCLAESLVACRSFAPVISWRATCAGWMKGIWPASRSASTSVGPR
ncbi:ADP-ribosylglycohydrolase family protein [Halomonas beimenensis]|uniref:ADP-ribosylglycohydrolase family protein n=1 Tax=Halomonas beimenensis TaxID=475662 RepID=UPI003605F7B4